MSDPVQDAVDDFVNELYGDPHITTMSGEQYTL